MFVRFHRDWWEEDKNRTFGNDINGIILNRINRGLAMDQVYVFNPSLLFNFRYGFTQQEFPERRVSRGFDLSSLGFSQNLTSLIDSSVGTLPRTAIGSLSTLAPWESGDGTTASLTHSFVGNFTWLKGSHNMRFGPEYRVYREFRNRFPTETAPDFSFSNAWARGPLDNSVAPPVGAEMVALMLGIPGGSMTRNGSYAEQDQYFALYFQDDWKVSNKLTLNLGLRAEHETPITERYDRSATRFFGTVANPIQAQAQANYARNPIPELPVAAFQVLGGLGFANVGGQPRTYWDGPSVTWMPRLGLAYQFNPKTVVRAGYGIFVGSIGVNKTNSNLTGFSQTTPMQPSLDNGLTFITTLQNPLPNGLLPPPGASQGLRTNLNQGLSFYPEKRNMPYAQRWSLGVQRELPGGFLIENAYVGNRGVRLTTTNNINNTPAQYLSTSPVRDQTAIAFLSANGPNPFNGIPAPAAYGANISRASLLRPYPHFGGISFTDENGYSWFHSMQARVEKRFSKGYTLQAGYTWSKAMEAVEYLNAVDPAPYESISGFDRKHRIVGSGQWELPFGKNRKWGTAWHPVVNFIAGGWQLNGVMQRQSGSPLGFGQALFVGDSSQIVLNSPNRNTDRWFNVDVFDSVANSNPAVRNAANGRRLDTGTRLRTEPLRYSNILTDSQRRWDFSAIKYFKMTERFTWQFRAETYNALNEVVLRSPNTDPYNANFGRVTAQEPPRSWQMSLKLTY
jgi:hypothetical protein